MQKQIVEKLWMKQLGLGCKGEVVVDMIGLVGQKSFLWFRGSREEGMQERKEKVVEVTRG